MSKKPKAMTKKMAEETALQICDRLMQDPSSADLMRSLFTKTISILLTDSSLLTTLAPYLPLEEGQEETPAPKKATRSSSKRPQTPAPFNPFEVAQGGSETLRARLEPLENAQLKDIIRDYGLDPHKTTKAWRKADRFVTFILDVVEERLRVGNGYQNSL